MIVILRETIFKKFCLQECGIINIFFVKFREMHISSKIEMKISCSGANYELVVKQTYETTVKISLP